MAFLISALLTLLLAGSAAAQVQVDIGIHFAGPPRLVVVPEVQTVHYVASGPANLFFYGGQYWVFSNGGWYMSRAYNGPWFAVGPQYVPRPLLVVPVHYYRVPPGHWRAWNHHAPPRWGNEWGREWAARREWREHEERREWREHDRREGRDDRGEGRDRDRGERRGRH